MDDSRLAQPRKKDATLEVTQLFFASGRRKSIFLDIPLYRTAHYTTNPPSAIQVAAHRTGSPACCSQFSLGVRSKLPSLFKSILVTRRDEASRSPYPTTDCKSECRAAMSSSGPRWLTTKSPENKQWLSSQ